MLEQLDMRRDVQEIFKNTPHEKQVLSLPGSHARHEYHIALHCFDRTV